MDKNQKRELLDASLERAAEQLGDITPHVMERYYAKLPGARERFEHFQPDNRQRLEGQMVEQVLYCLMEWYECPGEIEFILLNTIPHHIDTLGIAPEHFAELLLLVCDTIAGTIPVDQPDERAVLAGLRATMLDLYSQGASYARTPARPT